VKLACGDGLIDLRGEALTQELPQVGEGLRGGQGDGEGEQGAGEEGGRGRGEEGVEGGEGRGGGGGRAAEEGE
jgi:hypothetical protein